MNNPATQKPNEHKNLATTFGPEVGETACGENGMGRMEEPCRLFTILMSIFKKNKLKNRKLS